mmetsp:Transcript_20856/g.30000  ORF Transcript_20856/g.30000 Transcript_20856/m.30000 type:complete len:1048 (+) Transcript_20856:168-3311(+)|eukprot:CAMPEP_0185025012 /NCGR_PEP_ID=MMETSP1103-20130426/8134_1 /TAXON_ID=36769 /ORGANISM="Paraphysomonas bandaiensis, Strain Caron Lab Isolate" /LENGTH=1047 /DNA_ID=CAMNT_0027558119 /DNA_START=149 /DNA_END=3292 /DNA_ORIENTATION=-
MIDRVLLLLSLTAIHITPSYGQIYDLTNNRTAIDYIWLETGFIYLTDRDWVRVTTKSDDFVVNNSVVLTSLPDIQGNTHEDGRATALRLRNIENINGSVTFEAKMFLPNDSFCSKEWTIPTTIKNPLEIAWIVVHKGAFEVNGSQIFVGTGELSRTDPELNKTSEDLVTFSFPSGCTPSDPSAACVFPQTLDLTDISAVTTLQSLVYDTYLFLRVSRLRRKDIQMVLSTHDSLDDAYFNFPNPETAGYMAFPVGMHVSCAERMTFETNRFLSVTSNPLLQNFFFEYRYPPGVFGVLVTHTSFTDSTALRVFNRTVTDAYIITQEDQCASEQTEHTSNEHAGVIVVGETLNQSSFVCWVRFNSAVDTGAPSVEPSFAPSASPTVSPTFAPSANPTLSPTPNPTETPTIQPTNTDPTSVPTSSAPTFSPTASPTFSPTASPTSGPTASPTLSPTIGDLQCTYEILIVDLFGDGWVNVDLNVTVNGESTFHSLNCSCDVVTVVAQQCNIRIETTSYGEDAITPWEVLWQVDVRNKTWYGDADSVLQVRYDSVIFTDGMLSTDPSDDENQCHECHHPKPKPKPGPSPPSKGGSGSDGSNRNSTDDSANGDESSGDGSDGRNAGNGGAKPKPHPVPVNVQLFDALGNGWYDGAGSEDWCDSEELGAEDSIEIPDLFTHPNYYIMNSERTKLIKTGTICKGDRSMELCEEILPHHGDFVFRVAGFERTEDGEASSWKFCGEEGVLGDEMEFSMRAGKCIPGGRLTAEDFCTHGYDTVVGFSVTVLISGVNLPVGMAAGSATSIQVLPSRDTAFLEREISRMFFDSHGVTLTAVTVPEGSTDSLLLTLHAEMVAEEHGLDGAMATNVENLLEQMKITIGNSFSSGSFVGMVQNDLQALPEEVVGDDLLRSPSIAATLQDLQVTTVSFIDHGTYSSSPNENQQSDVRNPSTATSSSSGEANSVMVLGVVGKYVLVIALAGMAAFAAFILYTRVYEPYAEARDGRGSHTRIPDSSTHSGSVSLPNPTRAMTPEEEDPYMDADAKHNTSALFSWNKI